MIDRRLSIFRALLLAFAFLFTFNLTAQDKRVLFQGFWWDYENNNYPNSWANYLTELAPRLKAMGFNAVWIPPSIKNLSFGSPGVGYAPFDHYDLGDKFQKGSVWTRMGTKDELLRMVAVLHANGIEVVQDIVPNHVIGAGSDTGAGGTDPNAPGDQFFNFRYSSWATPATDQSAADYLSRSGRFPKNHQNFHPNSDHNCNNSCSPLADNICADCFGPDICYFDNAIGQSSNATYNPGQSTRHMRNGIREWLIWNKKQMGFDGVRIDAVKHFTSWAAEDFLFNLQNSTDFMNNGDQMFAVGEYVGGTAEVDGWYSAVQGRAGVFDFSLRAFDNNGGLYGMVYGMDGFDMATLAGAQQTQANRIHLSGVHRTVPFVNNHDTFRPQKDASGNYTGWNTGDELSAHIEPNEPRLAAAYAVIFSMDGNPQVFFEDLFDIGYTGNRFTHDPKSETTLPAREDLINLIQCHQKLDFAGGVYKVRSSEVFDAAPDPDVGTFVAQGQLSDHFVVERSGKALIGVTDNFNDVQEVFVDTDFAPGTVLMDYSGANGLTTYTVPADQRTRVLTQPVNYPTDSGDYHGYSVWAPVPGNTPFTSVTAMQAYLATYNQTFNTVTTQEWEMADDLGDSNCQSLMQGGALPAGSTNIRTVGKIFVQNGTSITYRAETANSVNLTFHNTDGTELHAATGSSLVTGSFSASYTGWVTAKIRNADMSQPAQTAKVRLSYTAPQTVLTSNFDATLTKSIWSGNAETTDVSDCRNWEEGKVPDSNTDVLVPAHANPKPAFAALETRDLEIEAGVDFEVTGLLEIHGDFVNNGTLSGCGTVRFAGTGQQNAVGSTTFCVLEIDNNSDLNLMSENTVTQELRFTDGKFVLNGGNLILASGATISGAGANEYVDVSDDAASTVFLVQEVGATDVLFPVGNAVYNPVTLNNAGTTANFSVRTFSEVLENGTTGASAENGNEVGQSWEITPDAAGVNTDVTLQWNAAQEGATFDRTTASAYKNDGADWANLPSGAVAGSNPYSITTMGVTSFSVFAVGSASNVLPAEMTDFRIAEVNGNAELTWRTSVERNNAGWGVEKSTDGENFTEIAFVGGAGNSSQALDYEYRDTDFRVTSYYRLRQTDNDGVTEYTRAYRLKKGEETNPIFTIAPNPFSADFRIKANANADPDREFTYTLLNAEGKLLLNAKATLADMEQQLNTYLATGQSGIYFLQTEDGDLLKLVKE